MRCATPAAMATVPASTSRPPEDFDGPAWGGVTPGTERETDGGAAAEATDRWAEGVPETPTTLPAGGLSFGSDHRTGTTGG
ncbi:hypothetical protein AB4Z54_70285, partial [Streptomyces sp. MCAF7]